MKIQNWILSLVVASSCVAQADQVKIMHLQMGGAYHNYFMNELMSRPSATGEKVQATYIPTPNSEGSNPFHLTKYNWDFGKVFFEDGVTSMKEVPIAPEEDLAWFKRARENGKMPEFMIISGHHIPGVGWHSDSTWGAKDYYTNSLLLSSLLRLREENADARAFFDNVRFVFISGCWGLSNMEPHGPKGEVLSQDDVMSLYASGPQGRSKVAGTLKESYSVEAQRWELSTIYSGDFSPTSKGEDCTGNKCVTYYIKRVMSDDGLLDNSRRYNQPYNLRKLFPNAALVFGFHSPSPYNNIVKQLITNALSRARRSPLLKDEDKVFAGNLINSIISKETPEPTKMRLVQAFREAWTTITWEQNKGMMPKSYYGGRPGASITPAYPSLDNDGVFAWPAGYQNPSFAPRCFQYRPDAKACAVANDN